MSDGVEQHDEPNDFIQSVKANATVTGVVAVEFFTCPHCENKQTTCHPFRETIKCGRCGTSMPSRSPRMPQPNEVSADDLLMAIYAAKRMIPTCGEETRVWIDRQEGHIRVACMAAANFQVHQVLDAILGAVRNGTGGHGGRNGG